MPELSAEERENYLLLLYFGASSKRPLELCVRRGYRDLNRTLHGLRKHPAHEQIGKDAHNLLIEQLEILLQSSAIGSQSQFDSWHERLLNDLCSHYKVAGFERFTIGQSQKWVNMSLKYAVIFGDKRIPGVWRLYPWLHAPIDNVVLDEMHPPDPISPKAWSRINDYAEYLSLQEWIREKYPFEKPLAVEFRLWKEGMENAEESSGRHQT